ncbi:MAG: hypothetical protein ISS33_02955 [Candidatus Omnitrophica bacterium]|nr:hypothetical protein [Candidatus Omnitrophota bacterium]
MLKNEIYRIFSVAACVILLTAGCGGSKKDSGKSAVPSKSKAVSKDVTAKKAAASVAAVKAPSGDVTAKETQAKPSLSKEKYGRKDPFAVNVTKKHIITESTNLNLQGIVFDTEEPNAIVNNQIVGVGGSVAGNRIVKINENSVVFNDGTEDFEIRLTSKR